MEGTSAYRMHLTHMYLRGLKTKPKINNIPKQKTNKQNQRPQETILSRKMSFLIRKRKIFHLCTKRAKMYFLYTNVDEVLKKFQL